MIAMLAGVIDEIGPDRLVLDVNGVGYLVFCSSRTLARAPRRGEALRLLVETHVREDHIHLYGFAEESERHWFRLLNTVQGVGARLALAILGTLAPDALVTAILAQDKAALTRAEGVGPKLGQRIVTELKDKVGDHRARRRARAPRGRRSGHRRRGLGARQPRLSALRGVRRHLQRRAPARAEGGARCADPRRLAGARTMTPPRVVAPDPAPEDAEPAFRPQSLGEFVGQKLLCDNLRVFIAAARARHEALDHVLLSGPPGLGKTTLAQIVAREMGAGFRATSGPVIQRAGDLAALLTNLEARDVLFIDEIHRLSPAVEEVLYPAMEDFQLDLMIGEGPSARSVKIDLPRFTLIGATTRAGLITRPLRERFGIPLRLQFYEAAELTAIVARGARVLAVELAPEGAGEIARRARGTPRVATRLLRRVRDFAAVAKAQRIDAKTADDALRRLEVDASGLDAMDRRYLGAIATNYGGGPVGAETLAAALGEERDVIEDVIEPYLVQQGFVQRTPRGRCLSDAGFRYLGLPVTRAASAQLDMLAAAPDAEEEA